MSADFKDKLVIAISSRALFDLEESHSVYERDGVEEYAAYQIANEDVILQPGPAFNLVKKLTAFNNLNADAKVEVILLSRNSADTGLRIFNSIEHYALPMTRAAFTSGSNPYEYVAAFGAHLFLSTHPADVRHSLESGLAAANIMMPETRGEIDEEVRIAFDGDAVIFSDESEKIYQSMGLEAFSENEKNSAKQPLADGPFRPFLTALHKLQKEGAPIRTALVTARSAPSHERVIRTLRDWGIRIDEALFLGGLQKGDFLRAFKADVFFDDQWQHCESASQHVPTGHVPHGVSNQSH